jgi:uncharacterized integral membrane protein
MGSLSRALGCANLYGVGEGKRPHKLRRDHVRKALVIAVGAYAVLFAVLNLDKVNVNWVIASGDTPLIVVIIVCLLIGVGGDRVLVRRARKGRSEKD